MNPQKLCLKPGKILDTIGAQQGSLTRTAKLIAQFILESPQKVTQFSIAEFSKTIDAGEATIIRFCRSLGYKGFQDFKVNLAIELATYERNDSPLLDAAISDNDTIHTVGLKLQATINSVLSETLNLLEITEIEKIVTAIRASNNVYIFGVGSSGITAEDMQNKLMRIGLRVDAVTNNHFMSMQASLLKAGDVAIGISHSGSSVETVHALALAKQSGATTVALTHNMGSPLMKYADYTLINGNRQGMLQGDSIGTKIAQLFVLDLIYTLLVRQDPETARITKLKTMDALAGLK